MQRFPYLRVELRPSRMLLIGGSSGHVLAGVAVVVASIPLWFKVGLIAAIGLALAWLVWRYGDCNGPGFIARVELLDGRWRLATGDGRIHRAQLTGGYAHLHGLILNFRLDNGWSRAVTLLADAADPDDLRQLRVWLRTQRDEPEPP
jgi:hypothetical protein